MLRRLLQRWLFAEFADAMIDDMQEIAEDIDRLERAVLQLQACEMMRQHKEAELAKTCSRIVAEIEADAEFQAFAANRHLD